MTDTAQPPTTRGELDIRHVISQLLRLVPKETATGETRGDRAALAALRRGLGKEPGEAPEMFPVLLPILPDARLGEQDERAIYLVASLFAFYPDAPRWPESTREGWRRNLGASLRQLSDTTESGGPERRLVALLNSDFADLPHHLRGIIALLRSAKSPIPVDWVRLTRDLQWWTDPERSVQKAWATAFWGGRRLEEPPDESPTDDQENEPT